MKLLLISCQNWYLAQNIIVSDVYKNYVLLFIVIFTYIYIKRCHTLSCFDCVSEKIKLQFEVS